MQEDNLEKWLGSSLRKAQEEIPVPYQEGAWEAFEKKRNVPKSKALAYWISGIAASLLLLIGYGLIQLTQVEEQGSNSTLDQSELLIAEEKARNSSSLEENPSFSETIASSSPVIQDALSSKESSSNVSSQNTSKTERNTVSQSVSSPSITQKTTEIKQQNSSAPSATLAGISPEKVSPKDSVSPTVSSNVAASDAENQAKLEDLKKQIAELTGDQEEKVESNQSLVALALGINPGFGAGTQNNQSVTGSSLGMGVQMSLPLSEKVSVGSGMGVNYFSQTSEGSGVVAFANAAYPTNERTEIEQVQVDLPLYLTYPLTRNKSISIQAGFSNIVAFNQTAQQETKYVRQVTVQDASTSFNSVSFRNESVTGFSSLDAPGTKFLPFATANLGVNIRVMESKKTSYLLMPFYNYPLQDISGTGNNIGFFGASLKVNFGTLPKK
mgnify:FL=1